MKYLVILILIIAEIVNAQHHVALFDMAVPPVSKENEVNKFLAPMSFELIDGMIVVEGELNQQKGYFILDTGAPVMIVNSLKPQKTSHKAKGISKAFYVEEVQVESFAWASIEKENIEAIAMDISHLERATQRSLLGLIGYDMLKDFEVLIDYQNHTIRFFDAKNNDLHKNFRPISTVSFLIENHLPIIKVKIGDKKLYLGLDTGAEANLIDVSIKDKLDTMLLSPLTVEEIQGLDQVIHEVETTYIRNTRVKALSFENMKFLFTDMSHLRSNSTFQLDGLLGFPFFSQHKCSINYKKRKMYFWE